MHFQYCEFYYICLLYIVLDYSSSLSLSLLYLIGLKLVHPVLIEHLPQHADQELKVIHLVLAFLETHQLLLWLEYNQVQRPLI